MLRLAVFAIALLSPFLYRPALCQEDSDRAVRILESVDNPAVQSSPDAAPATALPDLGNVKVENPAGVTVEILPGPELTLGTRVRFRIHSQRQGYLMLVSVDASGRLAQIYPNPRSLWSSGRRATSNQIRPGRPITIPDEQNPYAAFEFVAEPPAGVAMVVAILSDRPVQIIDLPDIPAQFAGRAEALKYLSEATRSLRIAQSDDQLQTPQWSFDARFYTIK
jgi:hypothetical protein